MKRKIKINLIAPLLSIILLFGCQGRTIEIEPEPVPTSSIIPTYTPIAPRVYPFNSENFIHLAWFYKPPNPNQINSLAQNFDFFILTHKDEETRDQLRFMGVNSPIFQYLLLMQIRQPDTCDANNYGNQVAYQKGDFCQIRDQHPDWFLSDKLGDPIHNGRIYYMDPGNSGFREFWLQRACEMQTQYKWDGLFIDNVEASLSKIHRMNITPARYPNDLGFEAAVNEFLLYLRENNSCLNGNLMLGNIVSVREDDVWMSYIKNLDGAMIESFAVDWSTGYKSADDWERQMVKVETALVQGKVLILVSQSSQYDDMNREQFAFASYLLVSNGNASFRYVNTDNYRDIWTYENLYIDPGLPLGPRYRDGLGWRRDFTNGYVTINPLTHSSQIEFTLP